MITKIRFLIAACTGMLITATLAMASPAFAAPTLEIDGTNGSYKIYSLLNGNPSDANSMKFSSTSFPLSAWALAYGSGDMNSIDAANWISSNIESDEILAALDKAAEAEGSSAAKVTQNEPLTLPAGYYLITGKNIKPAIAALSEDEQKKMKVNLISSPKFSEHIMIENGYSSFAVNKSDAGAGHVVTYRLECELPSDYENYETYFYRIADKLPKSVSADPSKIDVMYCSDSKVFNVTSAAKIAIDDNNILNVTFEDLFQIVPELEDGANIVVEFPVRISFTDLSCGIEEPNDNEAWGVFGEKEESANETEHDKSSFYSYKVTFIIENEEHEALQGAKFVLADTAGHYLCEDGTTTDDISRAKTFESGEDGKARIEGVGSGKYVLCQTIAPDGYDGLPSISLHIMSDIMNTAEFDLDVKASCEGQIKIEDSGDGSGKIRIIATLPERNAEGVWVPGTVDANSFDEATANSTADQFKPIFPTIEAKPLIWAVIAAIIIATIIFLSTFISKKTAKTNDKHPEYNGEIPTTDTDKTTSIKEEIEENLSTGEQTPLTIQMTPIEEYPDETIEDRIEYDGLLTNITDESSENDPIDADLIDDDDDEIEEEEEIEEEIETYDEEREKDKEIPESPQLKLTIQPLSVSKLAQPVIENKNEDDVEEEQSNLEQPALHIEMPSEDKYVAPEIANAVMKSFDTIETPAEAKAEESTVSKPEVPEVEDDSEKDTEKPKRSSSDFEDLMAEYRRLKEEIEGTIGDIEHDA